MRMEKLLSPRIKVVAAVIEEEGRLLIAKRPQSKRYPGKWEFAGGKVEAGETFHDAVRRELREEFAVDVVESEPPHFSVEDHDSEFVIFYCTVRISGKPKAVEHDCLEWVKPETLRDFDLAPGDKAYADFRAESFGRHENRSNRR